ncbi:MAG: deoxyguanosinetriphosphate triphosphohydrolase [SAR202 cluster bacterium]|nr:MAG: deoxyguanosinetriphosphate triphosphohydrolase [SAR202 cluster bacterium]KAA1304478.1 MAG: deoxyguanosinetriphosphate triphosphohydrolase [SAR202 cluster bacterium]MEE3345712.1 deoxyguanosinetriphosphate triphosphohydrolase [Chloroflexota bacterium]
MIADSVRARLEGDEERLSHYASRSKNSRGRKVEEQPSPLRTEFQRDRDRILHCKAFRRMKHKTQVFIAPVGDHFVTRLTHTLEVSQIARTISRALNLNEDLTEAIGLGHDMGHTPFGHIGEDELGKLSPLGFRHNVQSVRLVEKLEKNGLGLNLTEEVREGMLHHSKPKGDFMSSDLVKGLGLEAQIIRISDAIAYLNHDLGDAFRAGVLKEEDLPIDVKEAMGDRHSQRINNMVMDIVSTSSKLLDENSSIGLPTISMSDAMRDVTNRLREFMFERVYLPVDSGTEGRAARSIINLLYESLDANHDLIPREFLELGESKEHSIVDYISGMTDGYAIRSAESLSPGIGQVFLKLN